ncbi:unnamed protein product [Peniophora sp. CBMAI 1063]|nr:unnamed protein product [Peniophora sp. CBMAI 1063]
MPIDVLDDDVLVEIFQISALLDYPTRFGKLGWIRLTHVNRRWRTLLLDQQALWGHIICSFVSREAFRVILSRSRNAPLSLNLDLPWIERHTTIEEFASLLPRARDIHDASSNSGVGSARIPLAGLKMPFLEHAFIVSCYSPGSALIAPSLRCLSTCKLPCSISAPNLRILGLSLPAQEANAQHLPDLLATFPALEEFTIHLIDAKPWHGLAEHDNNPATQLDEEKPHDIQEASPHDKPRVALSHLKSLETLNCGESLIQMLWRSLVVPHTAAVKLAFDRRLATIDVGLAEPIQTYLSYRECDMLSIIIPYYRDEMTCLVAGRDPSAAGSCTLTVETDLPNILSFFSSHLFEHTRTLRLFNEVRDHGLRDLLMGIANTAPAGKFAFVESLQCGGPELSELAVVLASYDFPRLRSLELDLTEYAHDGDPVDDFTRVLLARTSLRKLDRIVLRGHFTSEEESKTAGDILHRDLLQVADEVVDERALARGLLTA